MGRGRAFDIDVGKLAEEARFDSVFVPGTNSGMTSLNAGLRCRELLTVEDLLRRASDRKAARKRRLLRSNRGLCQECGATPEKPRRRLCEACNEKHLAISRRRLRERKEERRKAGLCVQCGNGVLFFGLSDR